jgi:integrase
MILEYKFKGEPATEKFYLKMLRCFFGFCIDEGFMTLNPVSKSMYPKLKENEHKTVKEIEQILQTAGNTEIGFFIQFAVITGMRIQELINLKWNDVNEKEIKVTGKGDRTRYLPLFMFPELYEILYILKNTNKEKVFSWKNQQNPRELFNAICKKLNLVYIFHDLRRTAIERWKEAGINIEDRCLLAGHNEAVYVKNYKKIPREEYYLKRYSAPILPKYDLLSAK